MPAFHDSDSSYVTTYDCSGLDIVNSGIQFRNPLHNYGPVVRKEYTLQYVTQGRGILRIGSNTFFLKPNDLFLLPKDVLLYYQADAADPYTYYWIGIMGSSAPYLLRKSGLSAESPVINLPQPELKAYLEEMHTLLMRHTLRSNLDALAKLYELFGYLISLRNEPDESRDVNRHYIELAVDYIKQNFQHEINVSTVAREIGLGRSYFSTLFKKYMGISPVDYLINYRLSQACLLFKTGLTITEISYRCGFSDSANFSVRFKKFTGYSPKQYRKILSDIPREREDPSTLPES